MSFFKKIYVLACFISVGLYCENVEDSISQNEVVIDALQKQVDSMQSKREKEALQAHIDSVVEKQNKLLAQKAAGVAADNSQAAVTDTDLDVRIHGIVKDELAKAGIVVKSSNPYDTPHTPTQAELEATKAAEKNAPALPEQKSEAMGQYELALELYNKGAYKEAAASFGRIIKNYSDDPISAKALVHLAYCLEKQGNMEGASVVCDAALKKTLDDPHRIDCQLIRLRFAKSRGNDAEVVQIIKVLEGLPLNAQQQQELEKVRGKKDQAPAKAPQSKAPANPAPEKIPAK